MNDLRAAHGEGGLLSRLVDLGGDAVQKGQGTAWPLMARIFVFDDGIQKAAIVALDLLFLNPYDRGDSGGQSAPDVDYIEVFQTKDDFFERLPFGMAVD